MAPGANERVGELDGLAGARARRDALAEILGAMAFELIETEGADLRLAAPAGDGERS
jgi:hypothetical protein